MEKTSILIEAISMLNGPRVIIEYDSDEGYVITVSDSQWELSTSVTTLPAAYSYFNQYQADWMKGKRV